MQVSFIVIAFNARATIRRCLLSILAQPVDQQVILVDNASTDDTVACVSDLPITIVSESNRVRGAARNKGLEYATGEFIAFVDSDVELPPDWSHRALALLEQYSDVVAVGGPGLTPNNSWVSHALDAQQYGIHLDSTARWVTSLPTMNLLYRGNTIRQKRFARIWAAEDPEFNFHLSEQGLKFLWSRDLAVTHHHATTLEQLVRKSFQYGMWYLVPYWRHPRMIDIGVVARVLFCPIVIGLILLASISPIFFGSALGVFLAPAFGYAAIAASSRTLKTGRAKIQFVFVHSVKQYAQMLGIWAGVVNGTMRSFAQ
jgi:glycosyltransferase involved in cell wall biosynthesis